MFYFVKVCINYVMLILCAIPKLNTLYLWWIIIDYDGQRPTTNE